MKSRKIDGLRKLSIYGFQITENSHNFYALLEFDITNLRKYLREKRLEGNSGSLFAFMLKAIGRCLSLFPDFNSMINLKRVTTFEDVDISVPIEMTNGNEVFNKQLVIRDINSKTINEIDTEINESKKSNNYEKSYIKSPLKYKIITLLPNFIIRHLFNLVINNHKKVKELSGTAFVTSVSMFSNVPGFIIPYIGKPKSCSFAIGSVYKKPVVKDSKIVIREIINITAIFNHDMIDGAPAARFINQLRKYIETEYKELVE
jgi:pyruvate/2-oxoglutarate dehydrogenase complex dihydrolipoamide acyltransferase (E2) component